MIYHVTAVFFPTNTDAAKLRKQSTMLLTDDWVCDHPERPEALWTHKDVWTAEHARARLLAIGFAENDLPQIRAYSTQGGPAAALPVRRKLPSSG